MKINWRMLLGSSNYTILTSLFAVIAVVGLLSLAGCGGGGSSSNGGSSTTPNPMSQAPAAQTAGSNPASSSSILQPHNITSNRQMAVVYEAFYALRNSWLNPPNTTGPTVANAGGTSITIGSVKYLVSDWNYIGSDWNAVSYVAAPPPPKYGIGWDNATVADQSFFKGPKYGTYNGYGRGGECLFFVNLILWRSHLITDPRQLYINWGSIVDTNMHGKNPSDAAIDAQPGDLVFYKRTDIGNHIGICVQRLSSTSIDVIDSNYIGTLKTKQYSVSPNNKDPKYAATYQTYSEIIGRHAVSSGAGWHVFSGNGRWYGPGGH